MTGTGADAALTRSKSFGGAFGDWNQRRLGGIVSMDVGLTPGTGYCVMVRAIDVAGTAPPRVRPRV